MAAHTGVTRGPSQFTIWDPGRKTLKTMPYPYIKVLAAKLVLPAGTPMSPSKELIESMDSCDVERILPRHWHQTKGHPFEPFLLDAEMKELQDCCNRGVFGEPTDITDDMIVIGLMWVYAVKGWPLTGLFRKFRARMITLLGNQERHFLDRLAAYAPVAQSVTARILVAGHLHIPDVFYR